MIEAATLLQSYKALKRELGRQPEEKDILLSQRLDDLIYCDGQGISMENLSYLVESLDDLEKLCDLIEQEKLLLRSLNKVLTSIRHGEQKDATEEARQLRDKAYKTIETWLKGSSLVKSKTEDKVYSGIFTDDTRGSSVKTFRGGLPTLGKKR